MYYCARCGGQFDPDIHALFHLHVSARRIRSSKHHSSRGLQTHVMRTNRTPTLTEYDNMESSAWDKKWGSVWEHLYTDSLQSSEAHMRPHELETYRAVVAAQLA